MTWTAVVTDTFTRANTSTGSAGSTTGVGNGWIDQAGGTWNISSDTCLGTSSNSSGYDTQLLQRPSGEAALGQRITATLLAGNPTAQVGLCLRGQTTLASYYLFNYAPNTQDILIYAVVAGGPTSIGGSTSVGAPTTGHTLLLDAYVTGSNPTTLSFTVTDTNTSTVLCNKTITDSTTALQTAGVPGLVCWQAGTPTTQTVNFTGATTYTGSPPSGGTFTLSPSSVVGTSVGNVITVTGSGTSFTGSPFVITGGLGAYISAQTVTNSTAATVTLNPGLYGNGLLTLTDVNGTESNTLTVTEPSLGNLNLGFIGDSITYGTNGAPVTACATYLSSLGYTVNAYNQGQSGSSTNDWVPGDSDNYLSNAISTFTTNSVTTVMIMLGTNDIRTPYNYTAAQHFARMQEIVLALVAAGFQVVIHKPLYTIPNANFSGVLWPNDCTGIYNSYFKINMTLSNGYNIFEGDSANFATSQVNAATFLASDGVHPANTANNNIVGQNWAIAYLQRYGNNNQVFRPGFRYI